MHKIRKWLSKWEIEKIEVSLFPPFIKMVLRNKGPPK